MTAADLPLPPLAGGVARQILLDELGPQPVRTELDMIPGAFHAGHDATIGPDDRIEVTRRGSVSARPLDGPAVRDWCRDYRVGLVPDDVRGRTVADDPATADWIAARVADLVHRAAGRDRRFTVLSLDESVARRIAAGRVLWTDRSGTCWWRPAGPADPVRGGRGPAVPPPIGGDRGGSLLDRFRRQPPDAVEITEDAVRAAGMPACSSHESPAWPAVFAEVRRMAGAAPASPDDPDTGTGWLRRRTRTNTP